MHKDLEEIKRMLSIFPADGSSYEETAYVLEKICKITGEESRKAKSVEYEENKDYLIESFSNDIGSITRHCCEGKCEECFISKWCNLYRENTQAKELIREELTYADFFCGAGGLSWGFHRAGYKMSLANDIQDCCVDTIAINHPEVPEKHVIAGDINDVLSKIEELSRYSEIDIVAGGPPCQGFSMANRQRLIDDPRNHLYKSFIKAINILKPKFFVMENVRGMLGVKDQIIQDFAAIGYTASAHLLNAKDFGVPQNRERVIFIGNRIGVDNESVFERVFSLGTQTRSVVLSDALDNMPSLSAKRIPNCTELEDSESGYTFGRYPKMCNNYIKKINEGRRQYILFNHKARYNNDRDIEIFSRLNPGDNSADPKIADIMPYKRREKIFKDKYFKLEPDKPCKTITAHMKFDCNMYIHPSQARGLTPREAARIQSFPDDYFFRGSYTKTYMQVGNSVPPLLGEVLAKAIKEAIEAEVNR